MNCGQSADSVSNTIRDMCVFKATLREYDEI